MLLHVERLTQAMDKLGVDAVIATTPQNVVYTSGFWSLSHWQHRTTQVYSIVTREQPRAPWVVASLSQVDLLDSPDHWVAQVMTYGNFIWIDGRTIAKDSGQQVAFSADDQRIFDLVAEARTQDGPLEALQRALQALGLERARLAVDEGQIHEDVWKGLHQMPGVEVLPAAHLLKSVRMIKTPGELERIRQASEINLAAIYESVADITENTTEIDVARAYETALTARGARPSFTAIGFGERSAYPNAIPTTRKIRPGDLIRFDVGCLYRWYFSDLARTFCFREPSERASSVYRAILEGEKAAIEIMKPGVPVKDVFQRAVDVTREFGIPHYERHHCGHGVGLDSYDYPLVAANSEEILQAGMVFEIETPYYELGIGGWQTEDTVAVTENGPELYTEPLENFVVGV